VVAAAHAPAPVQTPAVTPDQKIAKRDQATGTGPKRGGDPEARDNPPAVPSPAGRDLAQADTPESQVVVPPEPPANRQVAVATPRKPQPVPGLFSKSPFDTALLARPPVRLQEPLTLEKLVAAPGPYVGQVVVPAGMYHLEHSQSDRLRGPWKYTVTELRAVSGQIRSLASTELEVEPGLAENFVRLNLNQRAGKEVILNVWVTPKGECGLVRVEILQNTRLRIGKGYKHVPSVYYETLEVTPERSGPIEIEDREWEQPSRMLPLAKRFKENIKVQQSKWRALNDAQVASQMNAVFQQSMQSVIRAEQGRIMRQQGVGGR
jgi:hypothetical protein